MTVVLLMLVVGLLLAWLFVRQGNSSPKSKPDRRVSPPSRNKSKYHAVSIKTEANSCMAAKALSGQRFLASEAPTLPLAECEMTKCECRFVHHPDRRSGHDRRSPFTAGGLAAASGKFIQERREGTERRTERRTESRNDGDG